MNAVQTRDMLSRSRGFTLLEIMIAILIISVGLAALANLQGKLTRYSAVAKQRTVAMHLAEQQIETMHSFHTMSSTDAGACATTQSGYDDLQTCTTASTITVGNLDFDLTWNIVPFVQRADGTTEVFTDDSGPLRPDLKLVTITTAWVDGQGDGHSYELKDIVDATSIFNTGRIMARVESNVPPRTVFNPANFPGVVEIAIGNDKLKGTTTPEPKILNQGTNVITSFDVVTFLQSDINAYLQRREEFKVINCICTLDDGLNTGREPTVWNGRYYPLGAEVSKRTGSVSENEQGQPAACTMCCNDHHDADGATVPYDPFRPPFSGDAGTFNFYGDHAHYGIDNGEWTLAEEGDDYLEACRYIRKDGFFRLTTDMALENQDVLRSAYPRDFNTDYSTSVIDFVTDFSEAIDVAEYPAVVPDGTYSSSALGMFIGSAGVTKPTMSRGIYMDYMTDALLKKVKCLQAGGGGTFGDFCDTDKDPTWLEILPFYDLDSTSLANFSKDSAAIEVTNSPISDIDRATFSRGEVSLSQDHFTVLTTVTADIEASNTGLTDTNPIDPDDEYEEADDMEVLVLIGGIPPAAGILVLGEIHAGSNQINAETVRVKQNPPDIACEMISVVQGISTQKSYVCDIAKNGDVASGTVTVTDYNALKITGGSSTVLNRKVCVDNPSFFSIQVFDDGVMANPDLNIEGEKTVMTFVNMSVNRTINLVIENEIDDCP